MLNKNFSVLFKLNLRICWISWITHICNDIYKKLATNILIDYICYSSESLFYKNFVDNNLCSTINIELNELAYCEIIAQFHDVVSCKQSSCVRGSYYSGQNDDGK